MDAVGVEILVDVEWQRRIPEGSKAVITNVELRRASRDRPGSRTIIDRGLGAGTLAQLRSIACCGDDDGESLADALGGCPFGLPVAREPL